MGELTVCFGSVIYQIITLRNCPSIRTYIPKIVGCYPFLVICSGNDQGKTYFITVVLKRNNR